MWEKIRVVFTIPELRTKILVTLLFLVVDPNGGGRRRRFGLRLSARGLAHHLRPHQRDVARAAHRQLPEAAQAIANAADAEGCADAVDGRLFRCGFGRHVSSLSGSYLRGAVTA